MPIKGDLLPFNSKRNYNLRPTSDRRKSVIPFKSGARASIVRQGYDVLADIGDQWSDVCGGYADHIYKLPNPTYYLP